MSIRKKLKKEHRDWTEEQIKEEEERIWNKYQEDNKDKINKERDKKINEFEDSLYKELMNDLIDNQDNP